MLVLVVEILNQGCVEEADTTVWL